MQHSGLSLARADAIRPEAKVPALSAEALSDGVGEAGMIRGNDAKIMIADEVGNWRDVEEARFDIDAMLRSLYATRVDENRRRATLLDHASPICMLPAQAFPG